MTTLAFSVPGLPQSKPRPRASARIVYQDGRAIAVVSVHSDPKGVRAEKAVLDAFKEAYPNHRPVTGAVLLRFLAVFPVPDSWPKAVKAAALAGSVYHTSKPDKDNIEKMIVDALNCEAFVDDCQIQGGGVKRYGTTPRLDIWLELVDQPDIPASPAEKRREARVEAGEDLRPKKRRRTNSSKAGKVNPGLQARIDAALERDAWRGRK